MAESDSLKGNIINIRESEADSEVPEKRQDNTNVASSFSPSIQDSPFLNNNNINIAGKGAAENANCQSGDGADSDGNTNVASSFSPSIKDSPLHVLLDLIQRRPLFLLTDHRQQPPRH
ncbi:hypothetical protein GJ744_011018 [Endocarpon pusillum]|uniref:Uncharacterized protein n=1 Tax=Endocarpon pusillum TaxID=364733 RepID=A0A8H7E1E0_9EURO|nr:hypothetical protein GJ744_011018 [Endocarpon pusillum]